MSPTPPPHYSAGPTMVAAAPGGGGYFAGGPVYAHPQHQHHHQYGLAPPLQMQAYFQHPQYVPQQQHHHHHHHHQQQQQQQQRRPSPPSYGAGRRNHHQHQVSQQQQQQQQQEHSRAAGEVGKPRKSRDGDSKYKTVMCRFLLSEKECPYGDSCCFAHSREELRNPKVDKRRKTRPCMFFFQDGYCPYGLKCHFTHDMAEYKAKVATEEKDRGLVLFLTKRPNGRLPVFEELAEHACAGSSSLSTGSMEEFASPGTLSPSSSASCSPPASRRNSDANLRLPEELVSDLTEIMSSCSQQQQQQQQQLPRKKLQPVELGSLQQQRVEEDEELDSTESPLDVQHLHSHVPSAHRLKRKAQRKMRALAHSQAQQVQQQQQQQQFYNIQHHHQQQQQQQAQPPHGDFAANRVM